MACRKCAAVLEVDGRALIAPLPSAAPVQPTVEPPRHASERFAPLPPAPSPFPDQAQEEWKVSFADKTVSLGAVEAAALSSQARSERPSLHEISIADANAITPVSTTKTELIPELEELSAPSQPHIPALPARLVDPAFPSSASLSASENEEDATRIYHEPDPGAFDPLDPNSTNRPSQVSSPSGVGRLSPWNGTSAQFALGGPIGGVDAPYDIAPKKGVRRILQMVLLGAITVCAVISLTFATIYLVNPELFYRSVDQVRGAAFKLGLAGPPTEAEVEGPAFDAARAGVALEGVAQKASSCAASGGPTGRGRADVRFSHSGRATNVEVSVPYAETLVGACLERLFLETRVPPYGGREVIVTKTFILP